MVTSSQVHSESQVVADGLAIDLLENLDITYQIVPDYDDTEGVVAGWDGDVFQYFITFSKLPPGWLNANVWMAGFKRDISAASEQNSLKILDKGGFSSSAGYDLHYIEISRIPKGEQEAQYQLVHFITNGKNSYLAVATPMSDNGQAKLRSEVKSILVTSHLPASNITPLIRKNEDRYIGIWVGGYEDSLKRNVEITFQLNSDLTFSRKEVIAGETDAVYTGVWSVSGGTISWTYLYGKPTSQENKSYETNIISSFDGDKLELVTKKKKNDLVMYRVQ